MKTAGVKWVIWAVVVAASWQWPLPVKAATKAEKAEAAKLVDETLRREAREGVENRRELLSPALGLTPPCEPAYWQSGFAYDLKRKEWLLPDEIAERAAKDEQLTAYRAARAKCPDTEKGHVQLARWCMRRRLDDQARAHWTKVLSFNPDQPEARRQLGFQKVNGTWLSQQEIANARAKVADFQSSLSRWGRKLQDSLKRLGGSNRQAREVARQELKSITAPDAVPAIEVVFCGNGGEYAALGIDLLKQMKAAQAAEALTWLAAFSPWKSVQTAATTALKDQRPHDYVPLLLGAMRTPIQSSFSLYDTPDGGFLVRRALYADGPEQRQLSYFDYNAQPQLQSSGKNVGILRLQQNPANVREYNRLVREDDQRQQADLAIARAKIMAQVRVQQATFAAQNANAQKVNSRLCTILAQATGDSQPTSPDDWYSWWNDYNEISQQGDKPFLITYQAKWEPVITVAQAPSLTCSCLVAGTPVLTELGSTAVEKIKVGDRVLACDCNTGEIMLKPVLKTIVNPGKDIFRLRMKNETLEVTGGHVFWVSGKGWVKARQLQPEMRFHTLTGTVNLLDVDQHGKQDTYNLVVADFHSYFVGKEKILTHDNTIRKPTNCVVPGLAGHVAAGTR
jgi:hypothetical protein